MGAEIQAMCNCNSDLRQNPEGKKTEYVNVITELKEVE